MVSPVSAELSLNTAGVVGSQTIELTGSDFDIDLSEIAPDCAILEIYVHEVSPGTTVSFSVSRANGDIWSGSYTHVSSWLVGTVTRHFGNLSVEQEYLAAIPVDNSFWIGYASDSTNNTMGIALADVGSVSSDALYIPVSYIDSLPLNRIQLSTDTGEVRVFLRYASISEVSDHIDQGVTSWSGQLISAAGGVLSVVLTIFAVFKFVFLDHFVALVVLYESIVIAYTASHSDGLITFFQKFVRYNERLLMIVVIIINFILDFFYRLVQAIKPI